MASDDNDTGADDGSGGTPTAPPDPCASQRARLSELRQEIQQLRDDISSLDFPPDDVVRMRAELEASLHRLPNVVGALEACEAALRPPAAPG
jgi:hypothetical protein